MGLACRNLLVVALWPQILSTQHSPQEFGGNVFAVRCDPNRLVEGVLVIEVGLLSQHITLAWKSPKRRAEQSNQLCLIGLWLVTGELRSGRDCWRWDLKGLQDWILMVPNDPVIFFPDWRYISLVPPGRLGAVALLADSGRLIGAPWSAGSERNEFQNNIMASNSPSKSLSKKNRRQITHQVCLRKLRGWHWGVQFPSVHPHQKNEFVKSAVEAVYVCVGKDTSG